MISRALQWRFVCAPNPAPAHTNTYTMSRCAQCTYAQRRVYTLDSQLLVVRGHGRWGGDVRDVLGRPWRRTVYGVGL